MVLYSGHGVFPRVIFAPGNLEEAFYLSQKAFNMAEKYQVPVFILSDQYLMDCYYNIPEIKTDRLKIEKALIRTGIDYKRYEFSSNGLSPLGIPGYGEGLVCLDSDEHDEEGHITENAEVREKMVNKRMAKLELIRKEAVNPSLFGKKSAETLIIAWGSNLNTVLEAMKKLGNDDIAFLHFSQIYPFPEDSIKTIQKAKNLILIENNQNYQFGQLVYLSTGVEIRKRILKYNGFPFSVEELTNKVKKMI